MGNSEELERMLREQRAGVARMVEQLDGIVEAMKQDKVNVYPEDVWRDLDAAWQRLIDQIEQLRAERGGRLN
jgi:hypothetical protein